MFDTGASNWISYREVVKVRANLLDIAQVRTPMCAQGLLVHVWLPIGLPSKNNLVWDVPFFGRETRTLTYSRT